MPEEKQILIVDDSPEDRDLIQRLLEKGTFYAYVIDFASDGETALEAVKNCEYDCIIMDVNLPDYSGVELLKLMSNEAPMVPIIMLTGVYTTEVESLAAKSGAYDFLIKGEITSEGIERSVHYVLEKANTFKRLRKAEKQAHYANEAKSQFLAQVSHEVRNPVHQILGLCRLLKDETLSNEQKEYTGLIEDAANKLLSLISGLLDVAKIESGKIELLVQPVDLQVLVPRLCKEQRVLAKERGINLDYQNEMPSPVSIETDELRLCQILNNFLSNAIKFTKEGSVTVRLFTPKQSEKSYSVAVSVTDTGIGIPKEKLETIFNPYEQSDASIQKNFGGTGLGMTIAQKTATLIGGAVRVESEEGKGSTFTVLLPQNAPPHYRDLQVQQEDQDAQLPTGSSEEHPAAQEPSIDKVSRS